MASGRWVYFGLATSWLSVDSESVSEFEWSLLRFYCLRFGVVLGSDLADDFCFFTASSS